MGPSGREREERGEVASKLARDDSETERDEAGWAGAVEMGCWNGPTGKKGKRPWAAKVSKMGRRRNLENLNRHSNVRK